MKSLADARLYTFLDTAYLYGRRVERVAEDLCRGGSDVIQLRAKTSNEMEIRHLASSVVPVLTEFQVPLIINDYCQLARDVGAQGCHLGQEDFFGGGFIRKQEMSGKDQTSWILGLSSHAPAEAQRALIAGVDYLGVGPVYETRTKPGRPAVSLSYVRWALKNVTLPWFAIGGITLENLDEVLGAGARRVCVVSAILDRSDIAEACHDFKKRLTSAPPPGHQPSSEQKI